jgi:putative hydrolase of the HAD superfamily
MRAVVPSPIIRGVVFDGDDTLWSTERLYDAARSQARRVVEGAGLDGEKWEILERRIDVNNVSKMGFTRERFPTSCVQAYEQLSLEAHQPTVPGVVERIRSAAQAVFRRRPRLSTRARKTLERLRDSGHKLALLTKGDAVVQRKRIETSGLRDLFDVIRIVPEKNPDVILDVVARLGLDATATCMVGNSIRSDILPAVEAGLLAIWINAHVWEYERAPQDLGDRRFTSVRRLSDIANLLCDQADE